MYYFLCEKNEPLFKELTKISVNISISACLLLENVFCTYIIWRNNEFSEKSILITIYLVYFEFLIACLYVINSN